MSLLLGNTLPGGVRGNIFSFLSPDHYVSIKAVSKETNKDEDRHVCACLSYFAVRSLHDVHVLDMFRVPLSYLQTLSVACHNEILPKNTFVRPLELRFLKCLEFFLDYRHFQESFDWELFFCAYHTPMLENMTWRNVSVEFDKMAAILSRKRLNLNIRRMCIPPRPSFSDMGDTSPEKTRQLVSLYNSCPALTHLRLDYDMKCHDILYKDMFSKTYSFSNLQSLQLVNRSKMCIDAICNDDHILPMLYSLDIMWLFESDPFCRRLDDEQVMDNTYPLIVRKRRLGHLKLTRRHWRSIDNEMICLLTLMCPRSVKISSHGVHVKIVQDAR